MLDIDIGVRLPAGDENTAATPCFGLMPPVAVGAQPQIDVTSHSIVDTPPVVLHHHDSTCSMDMTAAATASSVIDSNQVIGFSGDFVLPENFLEHQLPHVATASDAIGSFYTPGMNPYG